MLVLKNHRLPERPAKFSASELLHGDVDGFIINAYLAMQRQWPDDGGFRHYQFVLSKEPGARATILRELAASQTSRHLGSLLTDDLPPDFVYAPSPDYAAKDKATYEAVSHRLRLLQIIHESRHTRETIARMTFDGISDAVQTIVDAANGSLTHLDSRLGELEASFEAFRQSSFAAALAQADARADTPADTSAQADDIAWLRHEVLRLGRRVQALEMAPPPQPAPTVSADSAEVEHLRSQISHLKDVVFPLHQFATVDLKRQFADFANALVLAHADTVMQDLGSLALPKASKVDDAL
jgi:hypothetical protein